MIRRTLLPYFVLLAAPLFAGETGQIKAEFFMNCGGNSDLGSLAEHEGFPGRPDTVEMLKDFRIQPDRFDNFGVMIRGYVHPPTTGDYVFWLASDDNGALYLSPSDDPEKKKQICNVPEFTGDQEWSKFPSQRSPPMKLEAGKKYYIEARMKEGGGGDNLAVGWTMPDGKEERPIPGSRLSPATFMLKSAPPVPTTVTLKTTTNLPTGHGQHKFQKDAIVKGPGYEFEMSYCLFLPKNYAESKEPLPVVVFLCGNTHQGYDLGGIQNEGPPDYLLRDKKLASWFPFIGIFPQPPPNTRWDQKPIVKGAAGIIDEVTKIYKCDKKRLYITGLSMGGQGTWRLALEMSDRVAAISPISAIDIQPELSAVKLKNIHTWIIAGANDGGFTDGSRKMYQALSAAKHDVTLSVIPNEGHGVWARYYPDPRFYSWFLQWELNNPNPLPIPEVPGPPSSKPPEAARVAKASPGLPGGILAEYFRGLGSDGNIDSLWEHESFPNKPADSELLAQFEIPTDVAEEYGTSVRGYAIPPQTGNYTFWIAADDSAVLFLSSTERPQDAKPICRASSWTPSRAWDNSPEQKSEPIKLEAGKRYYIEAVHREGGGGDNMAVGWQLPDGKQERPIPGNRLAPAGRAKSQAVQVVLDAAAASHKKPGDHRLKARVTAGKESFELPFLLTLPKNYESAGGERPLLVVLHPESDNGTDLNAVINNGAAVELKANPAVANALPFILVSPQCPSGKSWDGALMAASVNGLLTELNKQIRIDANSVFITGSGTGAKGAVLAAMDAPERYSAAVPLSALDLSAPIAALYLKNTALLLRAGEKDAESANRSRKLAEELKAANVNATFSAIPGADANGTRSVFGKAEFYDELHKHSKSKPALKPADVAVAPAKKDPVAPIATVTPAVSLAANAPAARNPRELSQFIAMVTLTLSVLFLFGAIYFLSGPLKKSTA